MGFVFKGTGQTAALVVDEDEGNLVRVVVYRHGQDVGDDELGFTGTGHTGHQTVGTLHLFVEVQVEGGAVGGDTHRCRQGLGGVVFAPALQGIQMLHLTCFEHFQEGIGLGQGIGGGQGL